MLNVIMLSVIMLGVIMLNVVMQIVVAALKDFEKKMKNVFYWQNPKIRWGRFNLLLNHTNKTWGLCYKTNYHGNLP
jgi:hypothetical protein